MSTIAPPSGLSRAAKQALALRSFDLITHEDYPAFEEILHPRWHNREASDEPPAARVPGPRGGYATALWLRHAFADLAWETETVVVEDELVAVHGTFSGRHVNEMITYAPDASVDVVFPATGRRFAATHTHWLRLEGDLHVEHWANRDDMGTALQLGWAPPTPLYLVRMLLAKRRAQSRP